MSYDEALILCYLIIVRGWRFPVSSDHFDYLFFIVR